MKPTAEESADLKMALHEPITAALAAEADAFPLEADEAVDEVQQCRDDCHPASWVAVALAAAAPSPS